MTEQQEEEERGSMSDEEEREELPESETNGHVHFPDSPPPPPPVRRRRRLMRNEQAPKPAGGKGTGRTAMDVWPELLAECKATGRSVYNLSVRVVCDDPPPSRPIGNAFSANALLGDRSTSPGDRLYQYIRDNYHLTWAKGPCVYDIQFIWRDSGEYARRGSLQMPDPEEIIALRQNARRMGVYEGPPVEPGPPQRYQQPPSWEPPQQSPQYAPPAQYAPPPRWDEPRTEPPAWRGGGGNIEVEQLRAELQRERENTARLQGQMSEILQALREGRSPTVTAAPAPAQPAQDLDGVVMRILDRIGFKPTVQPAPAPAVNVQMSDTEAVIMRVLGAMGIKPGVTPGVGVGAAPPQSPRSMADELDSTAKTFDRVLNTMAQFRGFTRKVDKMFGADGEIPSAELAEEQPAQEGAGKLPFDAVEIPQVKWADGRPVMFAASRETGKLDPTGALFSNPAVIEKAAEGFSRFMGVLGQVVQAAVKPQPGVAEVVDEIPAGAQEASGGWAGVG